MGPAECFMLRVRIQIVAPSPGGMETLVTQPAATSHTGMSFQAWLAAGITDSLVRLSIKIESPQDLIDDMDNALRTLRRPG